MVARTLVCKDNKTSPDVDGTKINKCRPPSTLSTSTSASLAQTLRTCSIRLAAAGEVLAAGALMEIVNNMEGRKS